MTISPLPRLNFIEVQSKNKLLVMSGSDPSKWKHRIIRGYALMVMERSAILQCGSCLKSNISLGSLYGFNANAPAGRGHLCADCLSLPSDYTIFEVKILLRRKSGKNPSGIRTEIRVSTVSAMKRWMKKVVAIYPGSSVKHIYDHRYSNMKKNFDLSMRLGYILKSLWAYLPEISLKGAGK